MTKIIKKLLAPFAIFSLALGFSISVNNWSGVVGAKAVGEETGVVSKSTSTGSATSINNGLLTFGAGDTHLKLVGGSATYTVSYAKNSSTTTSIFNNSGGEVRLYGGSGNGAQLTFAISSGFFMKEVTVTTSQNNGYTIDGGPTVSDLIKTTIITNQTSFVIKNVATGTGQVRIVSVSIVYKDSEYIPQTFGTLTSLNIDTTAVNKSFVVGDTFSSSGLVAIALDEVNFEKNVTSLVVVDLDGTVFNSSHIGTQVVTVSYTEELITVTKTYNIEVIPITLFRKVVSSSDLHFGARYIIANEDGTIAMSTTQNTNNRSQVETSKIDDDIKFISEIQEFSLEIGKVTNTFAFKATNGPEIGKYIASASSSSNNMNSNTTLDANGSWLITISDDTVITSQGNFTRNHMRYNSTSFLFSSYASDSSVVGKVSLYLLEDSIDAALSAQMYVDEVNSGLGSVAKGTCEATLELLNSVYNRISATAKTIVDSSTDAAFVNARARIAYLTAWVAAHPSGSGRIETPTESSLTIMATLIIGLIGISSLVGFYFITKKSKFQ